MKARCKECSWVGDTDELLCGENPFKSGNIIYGCPQCKSIGSDVPCCDEDGCLSMATCGASTSEGYRQTCHKHYPGGQHE